MKTCLALLAALLFPSILPAQSPPPPQAFRPVRPAESARLSENYAVTLRTTDGDGQPLELTVVTNSTQFDAKPGEQNIQFSGGIYVEETGELFVSYALGWDLLSAVGKEGQIRHSSAQGSVRLKLGEEIQIYKAGAHTIVLGIKQAVAAPAK